MSANRQLQAKQWQSEARESIAKFHGDAPYSERDDRLFRASTHPIRTKVSKKDRENERQSDNAWRKAVSSGYITRNGFRVFDPTSEMTEESFKS
jgi:hypothetical protein